MIKSEELDEMQGRVTHYACIGARVDILKLIEEVRHLKEMLSLKYELGDLDLHRTKVLVTQALAQLSRTGSENLSREALRAFDEICVYQQNFGFKSGAKMMKESLAYQIQSKCEVTLVTKGVVTHKYCGECESCKTSIEIRQADIPLMDE